MGQTTQDRIDELEADLAAAKAARRKIFLAQSYSEVGRSKNMPTLKEINDTIRGIQNELQTLKSGGLTVLYGVQDD